MLKISGNHKHSIVLANLVEVGYLSSDEIIMKTMIQFVHKENNMSDLHHIKT